MNGKERRQGQESKAFPRATDILEVSGSLCIPSPHRRLHCGDQNEIITLGKWPGSREEPVHAPSGLQKMTLSDPECLEVLIRADSSSGKGPSRKTKQTLMS